MTHILRGLARGRSSRKTADGHSRFMEKAMNRAAIKTAASASVVMGILAASLAPLSARAAVTAKDIQVAARVLGFTNPPQTGSVKFGIVYDPAIASSAADEQALVGILGSGLAIGSVTLVPVPITMDKLGSTPANVLFLTSGLGADAAKVGAQADASKTLCVTTDLAATQAGSCAVSVQTTPSVQITVNKAAAAASGISFASTFMLMITEI